MAMSATEYERPPLSRLLDDLLAFSRQTFVFVTAQGVEEVAFAEMRSRVLAHVERLSAHGVTSDAVVGLVVPNGRVATELDLALGVLGAKVVHAPEASAQHYLESLDPMLSHLIRVGENYRPPPAMKCVEALDGCELWVASARRSVDRGRDLCGVCAVAFSSGSSGHLKKLLVRGEAVVHHARTFFAAAGAGESDAFLLFLPFSNYQQKLLVYGSVMFGVRVIVADQNQVFAALRDVEPTLFLAPPVFYESALRLAEVGGQNERDQLRAIFGRRVRILWTGMAPVSTETLHLYGKAGLPLFEAYGMTEYGPICTNLPGSNRIGSVGRPVVPGSVRIREDGEVVVLSPVPLTRAYLDEDESESVEVYLSNGEIATGDLGELDEDGFLFLRGRKKELLLGSSGHKVHPRPIEMAVNAIPGVLASVLMGTGRPYLGLMVFVDSQEGDVAREVNRCVDRLNDESCRAFPIRSVRISSLEPSVENGLLTRNMKLNRPAVVERFEKEVFAHV